MADRYEDRSREELYELAQEKDIEGRSTMDKDELIAALRGDRKGSGSSGASVTVPAGQLPPTGVLEVYKRTVDGSGGNGDDLDGSPVKTFDKVRGDGDVVLDGLAAGPVWVVVGSHVQIGTATKDD